MNILALTSVYPQPDDKNKITTPTVKYFCDEWNKAGHTVLVIHNKSCFPRFFYAIPKKILRVMESKLGHAIPDKESRNELQREENGMKIYRLPMKKIIPYRKYSDKAMVEQYNKIIKILDRDCFIPDVIVGHWVNPQMQLMMALAEKFPNAKTSLVFHSDCFGKNIMQYDLVNNIQKFDAIGCRSKSYAEYVKDVLHLNKTPFICYSGVPDEQVDKQEEYLNLNDRLIKERNFLYVGRLIKYKNVDTIIKALSKVYPLKNFRLNIVGDGAEKNNLEILSKDLGISDNIVFWGQIDREEVFNLMRNSFCFTMVSDYETFGMVYIEALLAGCVTVASKYGGVDGVIVDGKNGFLSNQGDVDGLVKIYKRIENMDENDIQKIRENGIKTAYGFRDSIISQKYLDDILSWKD